MVIVNFALVGWLCLIAAIIAAICVFVRRRRQKMAYIADYDPDYDLYSFTYFVSGKISDPWMNKLYQMDKTDPAKRACNWYDEWFERNVEYFADKGRYLAYINKYGWLEDKFWECIKEPDKNLKLQKLLISVYPLRDFGLYAENFSNMLFHYAQKYQFAPEQQKIIDSDERFAAVKRTCEIARR